MICQNCTNLIGHLATLNGWPWCARCIRFVCRQYELAAVKFCGNCGEAISPYHAHYCPTQAELWGKGGLADQQRRAALKGPKGGAECQTDDDEKAWRAGQIQEEEVDEQA